MATFYASYPVEGGGTGTVTSIDVSGGATGLTTSGGPITTSGVITLGGTLNVAHGGTGDTTLTLNGILFGNGTSPVGVTAAGTTGEVLTATSGGAPTWQPPATSGTVTSVAMTVPSVLSVSGSPITSSGTLAVSYSGTPLPLANGGTGQTSAAAAFQALAPLTTAGDLIIENGTPAPARLPIGSTGNVLTVSGGLPAWAPPATSGTVTSVAATVPSLLSVSGSPITSSGTLAFTYSGTPLPVANGGTGQTSAAAAFQALSPLTTAGDLIFENASPAPARLPVGSTGNVLTVSGGLPAWAPPATSGTVTSVAMTVPSVLSISGSPITSSGTLAVSYSGTALPVANGGTGVTSSTGSTSVVLSGSPTITTPTLVGVTNGSAASVGNVGYFNTASLLRSSATSVTSSTPKNIVTASIPAGDWLIQGTLGFIQAGGSGYTIVDAAISATSATLPATNTYAVQNSNGEVTWVIANSVGITPGGDTVMVGPYVRVSLNGTTSYFLVINAVLVGASTMTAYGSITYMEVR